MLVIDLKKYIYEKKKVELVLLDLGCKHILYHPSKLYWSCSNPDGDNTGAINITNNEYLGVKNYTRKGYDDKSDIITLVINTKKRLLNNKEYSFIDAIKYLHKLLGLNYSYKKEDIKEKRDVLYIFKKVKRCKKLCNVLDYNYLDENRLEEYIPILHINWLREGIMPWTADKFGLAYSYERNRIVIPLRYWLNGNLMGFNMRTTIDNYDELGIKKYLITNGYPKQYNLFGLWENKDKINQSDYVVVVESEKSVMKRDSLNDCTCVAISGHEISDEQARILIGLNKEIIICFDKDVDINEVRYNCEKFYHIRKVSYMYDKWGILSNKDSPCDKQDKIYQFMLDFRFEYNEFEHNSYIKSLNKNRENVV